MAEVSLSFNPEEIFIEFCLVFEI